VVRRIFAIATDSAGCWHYRLNLPLTHLDPTEFEVIWGPPSPPGGERLPGDVVIGQRIVGYNTAWQEMCEDPGLLAVYDLDDNLLDLDPGNPTLYSIFMPQADETRRNIALADVVTVSTRALAEFIRPINPNVVVLPNCSSDEWLTPVVGSVPITVGWAGSFFHHQDWPGIPQQLGLYQSREPRVKWHMIGADYTSGMLWPLRVDGWSTIPAYLAALDFTIGIAPLNGSSFNGYKSHCKVLEYASRGIVPVASRNAEYPEFIDHGFNGLLVDRIEDWPDHLSALSDDTLREKMAVAARATAETFHIRNHIHRWAAVYRGDF
jgi:O-antigen biosynthesis protein